LRLMEWLDRLNMAMDYIERSLEDGINVDEAAHIACCSSFHFQRMFSYIAGLPLSEYVRRRRMSAAAFALQQGARVIDLALTYGYDSPTAFSRAFRSVHGVSPSQARRQGVSWKAYPCLSFHITIKGDTEMNYRIEEREAFRIVGAKAHFDMNVEEGFAKVPQFWAQTTQSGLAAAICALPMREPFGLLGVSTCMNGRDFDYYIAVATDAPVPDGMEAYTVPAATWAMFECMGPMPQAIQQLQTRVVSEWLPASGYEYADAPDIEVYPEGDTQSVDYRCEVWLPVRKA
jgi:AraC family transcriptional regulator